MLLVKYTKLNLSTFVTKYSDKVKEFKVTTRDNSNWLIEMIESIKQAQGENDIVIVDYLKELILSFNALKISYKLVYPLTISNEEYLTNKEECDVFKELANDDNSIIVEDVTKFEVYLANDFDWINIVKEDNKLNDGKLVTSDEKQLSSKDNTFHQNLTLQELIDDNTIITEADVRELKSLTNKFKVAMMLQAKSRLNTVLSLCSTLDKLYVELVKRVDLSVATTDTASLMYTADYISKALNDTNQFIMSLITSEKLQNFFIIDNSNVIISDDRVDIDKREKIRKAAEIVMDNIDYFAQGQYDNIKDPNNIEVEGEVSEVIDNAKDGTKSV